MTRALALTPTALPRLLTRPVASFRASATPEARALRAQRRARARASTAYPAGRSAAMLTSPLPRH